MTRTVLMLALFAGVALPSAAISAPDTKSFRYLTADNLPAYWLPSVKLDAKISTAIGIDSGCAARAKMLAPLAKQQRLAFSWPVVVNVKTVDHKINDRLRANVAARLLDYGIEINSRSSLPLEIFVVPPPNSIYFRSHVNGDEVDIYRPGFIERLYFSLGDDRCLMPMNYRISDQNIGRDFIQQKTNIPFRNVPMERVFMSPRLLLPALQPPLIDQYRIDRSAKLSESAAIVDHTGKVTRLVCFISDVPDLNFRKLDQSISDCFDILVDAVNYKQPTRRRYFDGER